MFHIHIFLEFFCVLFEQVTGHSIGYNRVFIPVNVSYSVLESSPTRFHVIKSNAVFRAAMNTPITKGLSCDIMQLSNMF